MKFNKIYVRTWWRYSEIFKLAVIRHLKVSNSTNFNSQSNGEV